METLSLATIGVILFVSTILWIVILQWIISDSTRTHEKVALEAAQLKILIQIALKGGVSQSEIDSSITSKSVKKILAK